MVEITCRSPSNRSLYVAVLLRSPRPIDNFFQLTRFAYTSSISDTQLPMIPFTRKQKFGRVFHSSSKLPQPDLYLGTKPWKRGH